MNIHQRLDRLQKAAQQCDPLDLVTEADCAHFSGALRGAGGVAWGRLFVDLLEEGEPREKLRQMPLKYPPPLGRRPALINDSPFCSDFERPTQKDVDALLDLVQSRLPST